LAIGRLAKHGILREGKNCRSENGKSAYSSRHLTLGGKKKKIKGNYHRAGGKNRLGREGNNRRTRRIQGGKSRQPTVTGNRKKKSNSEKRVKKPACGEKGLGHNGKRS